MRKVTHVHAPFTLFKKPQKDGPAIWYAKIWDYRRENWSCTRSTRIEATGKKENRDAARDAAREIVAEIDKATPDLGKLSFLEFVAACWNEGSDYLEEFEAAEGHPLSAYYVSSSLAGIKNWVLPFKRLDIPVEKVTPGDIDDWRTWARRKGCTPRRVMAVEQSIRIPIRRAVRRGDLTADPFGQTKEKHKKYKRARDPGVITLAETARLIQLEYKDPRVLFACKCAALCGLRRGEIRGLRWGDIDLEKKTIRIENNVVPGEPYAKGPKWGSSRETFLPGGLLPVLEKLGALSEHKAADYILFDADTPSDPIGVGVLRYGFPRLFDALGIGAEERESRNIKGLHSLRHSWITNAAAMGISRGDIMELAGHSQESTTAGYTHTDQVIDFASVRSRMEAALKAAGEPD